MPIGEAKRKADLFYKEGSADKVYHVTLDRIEGGGGYTVNFSFGRRGSTLNTGTKTQSPVDFEKAGKIFDKVVAEKMAKGYTAYEGGTPYSATDKAGQVSGILPQLLNPIEEEEAERLLYDDDWWMQEKFDGRRLMVRKKGAEIVGINRKGLMIALPGPIHAALSTWDQDFVLDGESIGDTYHVFDYLEDPVCDIRGAAYSMRYLALMNLVAGSPVTAGVIRLVPAVFPSEGGKANVFNSLKASKAEGVVFKRADAPYTIGRPNSGGPALKFKFYSTASVRVVDTNDKRSVRVAVLLSDRNQWVDVGNVTIPPNQPMPYPESILEVRYLYAHKGGSLYQPTSLGMRADLEHTDCTIEQLKYKADTTDEE